MSDRDDITKPLDHLPPKDERDDATEIEQPEYPVDGAPADESRVSPATAAEPTEPARHGVDKLPPAGR